MPVFIATGPRWEPAAGWHWRSCGLDRVTLYPRPSEKPGDTTFVYPETEGQAHMFLGTPVPTTPKLAKQGNSNHRAEPYWQSKVAFFSLPGLGPASIFPLTRLLFGGMIVVAFPLNHIFFN